MARGLIAVGVIAAIVAVLVLTSKPQATSEVKKPENDPKGPAVIAPVKIVLECEEFTPIETKGPDGREVLVVRTQSEGKTISFLEMPEKWIEECGLDKGDDALKGKPDLLPGRASYTFEAPRNDTFYINLRAKWADNCGDSVYVKIDDGEWYSLEDSNGMISEKNYRWAWHQLMVGGKPKGFELKQGKHTLYLGTREDGPCLDQWVITTEASMPVGEAAKKN
ncbi:MAG TPA: hypothetical protein VEJ63_16960 [Planctomycetota bacterium]|nr:hypothetical protein [Planctomycetota bacterium]